MKIMFDIIKISFILILTEIIFWYLIKKDYLPIFARQHSGGFRQDAEYLNEAYISASLEWSNWKENEKCIYFLYW